MLGSKEQQKWQAEDDARVMAQYQEILADKNRMNRAIKVAQKQAENLQKRANVMQSIATTKSKKK